MALIVNQSQGEKVRRSPGDREWKGAEPRGQDQGVRNKKVNRHSKGHKTGEVG